MAAHMWSNIGPSSIRRCRSNVVTCCAPCSAYKLCIPIPPLFCGACLMAVGKCRLYPMGGRMADVLGDCALSSSASVRCVTLRLWPKLGWEIDRLNIAASVFDCFVAVIARANLSLVDRILSYSVVEPAVPSGDIWTPSVLWDSSHCFCAMSATFFSMLSVILISTFSCSLDARYGSPDGWKHQCIM